MPSEKGLDFKEAITYPYKLSSGIYYPVIDLYIATATSPPLATTALVDSGATFSVFRAEELEKLGVSLKSGKYSVVFSANSQMDGYLHKLKMRVGMVVFDVEIIFSRQLRSEFNLLGRRGFFEKFHILVEENKKRLHLLPI